MDVLMPQLGETVTEGTISAWFKSIGEVVAPGENLFEIETDKAAMEVQALGGGVLTEIRGEVGATLDVGAVVAVISARGAADERDAAIATAVETDKPNTQSPPPSNGAGDAFGPFSEVRTPTQGYGRAGPYAGLRSTPLARRLAAQNNIDLRDVARAVKARGGSRIAKADVLALADSAPSRPPSPQPPPGSRRVALNKIRQRTGSHLTRAWQQIPHVLQAVEVDFHHVEARRRALNNEYADDWGFKLSYLAFIGRAVCLAIRTYPMVNASVDGDELIVHSQVNLGIAVDLGHHGLVVPVIHGADDLNLIGLARAAKDAAVRARDGALTPHDLAGGTYTISNSGTFGTLITAPIVNPPEVAILSTDGVAKRPVVVTNADGDHIAIRPVGVLAQSFDHRAFDGAYSAAFLDEVRRILETRDWRQDS